jgi:hypothetical protein
MVRGGICILYGGKNNSDMPYHEMYVLKLNEKNLNYQPIMLSDCVNKKHAYTTFFAEGNIVKIFQFIPLDLDWRRHKFKFFSQFPHFKS